MRSEHIRMSWEEFELLPRRPGWKCEYWDGQVHLSPRHLSAVTTLRVGRREVRAPLSPRPVRGDDQPALVQAYIASFGDTVEYCDWEPAKIETSAREILAGFFAGARGQPLPASRVAVDSSGGAAEVAGAALIVADEAAVAWLDLLFVDPCWRRRGLARALVAAAVNELHHEGVTLLRSRYHVGNDESCAWHRAFGFVEEPDLALAQLYVRLAEHELWRRETLGDLEPDERQRLSAECERWRAAVDELEKLPDPRDAHAFRLDPRHRLGHSP